MSGADSTAQPGRGRVKRPATQGRRRVLFIDDDANLARLAYIMLEHHGCEVTTATEGPTGLQLVLDQPDRFDLVITDQVMPELTGIALAARIRSVRPDLPVVLCTGGSHDDEEQARQAGIREVVFKPLNSLDLGALLDRLLPPVA